ncbi:hypothetical protein Taro_019222 [Colocasia esculenta]|uniref:Uncharacterized protein n=1 Tax=Colocasia esculenta TaxID=4460 RepID=A0A843USV1_COLES|nr:hypothetical protein [Colocasia esculenta]
MRLAETMLSGATITPLSRTAGEGEKSWPEEAKEEEEGEVKGGGGNRWEQRGFYCGNSRRLGFKEPASIQKAWVPAAVHEGKDNVKRSWFERNTESVELMAKETGSEEERMQNDKQKKICSLHLKKLQQIYVLPLLFVRAAIHWERRRRNRIPAPQDFVNVLAITQHRFR